MTVKLLIWLKWRTFTKEEAITEEYWSNPEASVQIARDHDSETIDISELENLSKRKKPQVRNADQTQDYDENDTDDAMGQLEDLVKNRKIPGNVQKEKRSINQEKKKMKNSRISIL